MNVLSLSASFPELKISFILVLFSPSFPFSSLPPFSFLDSFLHHEVAALTKLLAQLQQKKLTEERAKANPRTAQRLQLMHDTLHTLAQLIQTLGEESRRNII